MHDNSPVHVGTLNVLNCEDIFRMNNVEYHNDWPPNSPDMNPTEKALNLLQLTYFNHLDKKIKKPKNKAEVFRELKECWYKKVNNETIQNYFRASVKTYRKVVEFEGDNCFKA